MNSHTFCTAQATQPAIIYSQTDLLQMSRKCDERMFSEWSHGWDSRVPTTKPTLAVENKEWGKTQIYFPMKGVGRAETE